MPSSASRLGLLLAAASLIGCPVVAPPDVADDDDDTPPAASRLLLRLPVADPAVISQVVGFDHDPEVHEGSVGAICTAYDGSGFPSCYDEHHGSDFILDGGFEAMDDGSVAVVAAAAGVVIDVEDRWYDRCHAQGSDISCDGKPVRANTIAIDHGDGLRTRYVHLMRGSAIVERGDEVECGQPLALVGSSGRSAMPHLHLDVRLWGHSVDPFAGEWSQPETFWTLQDGPWGLPGEACGDAP